MRFYVFFIYTEIVNTHDTLGLTGVNYRLFTNDNNNKLTYR